MKDSFDIMRMFSFLKYLMFSGKKNMLIQPLMLLVGMLFANFAVDAVIYTRPEAVQMGAFLQGKHFIFTMAFVFVSFYTIAYPARVQQFVMIKNSFSRYMMLPVSDSERFAAVSILNYIYTPIVFYGMFLLGFAIAALPEMLVFSSFDFQQYYDLLVSIINVDLLLVVSVIMTISTFSLGAFFWHRHPAIKTFGVWFAFYCVVLFAGMMIERVGGSDAVHMTKDTFQTTSTVLCIIAGIVCITLSWFAFKKRSVISRSY